jgi:ribonuclease D
MRRPSQAKSKPKICFKFQQDGDCQRGETCKFLHESSSSSSSVVEKESNVPSIAYVWIDKSDALATAMRELEEKDKMIAVDFEFMTNSWNEARNTYGYILAEPVLCLVQIRCESSGKIFVIDIQRIEKPFLKPLWNLLENASIEKIMHDCQEEGRICRLYQCTPVNVFDTQVAAFFTGFPYDYSASRNQSQPGLKKLVEHFVPEVTLDKEEQKSNWMGRLSEKQIQYAASDVLYLHQIRNALVSKFASTFVAQCVAEDSSRKLADRSHEKRGKLSRVIGRQEWSPLQMARLRALTKNVNKFDERVTMKIARGNDFVPNVGPVDERDFVKGETPEEFRYNTYAFSICQALSASQGVPFECVGLRSSDMSFPNLISELKRNGTKTKDLIFEGWRNRLIGEPLFQLVVNKKVIEFESTIKK